MSTRERVEGFHVGMRIARRDVKRWTQKELAFMATEVARKQTGDPDASVSLAMVGMIESQERNPSLEVAGWLAEALGYQITDLGLLRTEREPQVVVQ